MVFSSHVVALLKEYMWDLVEQAEQETATEAAFALRPRAYGSEEALADLMILLDDRLESEGLQVGLSEDVIHHLWTHCHGVRAQVATRVWMEAQHETQPVSKARIRAQTYRVLVAGLERPSDALESP